MLCCMLWLLVAWLLLNDLVKKPLKYFKCSSFWTIYLQPGFCCLLLLPPERIFTCNCFSCIQNCRPLQHISQNLSVSWWDFISAGSIWDESGLSLLLSWAIASRPFLALSPMLYVCQCEDECLQWWRSVWSPFSLRPGGVVWRAADREVRHGALTMVLNAACMQASSWAAVCLVCFCGSCMKEEIAERKLNLPWVGTRMRISDVISGMGVC